MEMAHPLFFGLKFHCWKVKWIPAEIIEFVRRRRVKDSLTVKFLEFIGFLPFTCHPKLGKETPEQICL